MPLQNRVNPFGELCAFCARGLFMGNRGGRFHTDAKTLTRRRWASRQWICCVLKFKGRRRDVSSIHARGPRSGSGLGVVKTRRRASRENKSSFKSPFTQPGFFFDRSSRRNQPTEDCAARLRAAPPRQRGDVRLPPPRARCGAGARGLTDDAARSAVEYAVGADEGALW